LKSGHAIKELNKIAGLEDIEVDTEKIKQVNYDRVKAMSGGQ